MRTALEQELGLAAYFVSNEVPVEKGTRGEALESDAEKLSSTDNEDEELATEGEGRCQLPAVPRWGSSAPNVGSPCTCLSACLQCRMAHRACVLLSRS